MKPELKQAKQQAFCRSCDGAIQRGEWMVSFYSSRNTGMWIHICPSCAEDIGGMVVPTKSPYIFSASEDWTDVEIMFPDGTYTNYDIRKEDGGKYDDSGS